MQVTNPLPALSVVVRYWPVALAGGLLWTASTLWRMPARLRAVLAAVVAFFAAALVIRVVGAPYVVKAVWLYGGTAVVSLVVAWAVHPFVRWYWRQLMSGPETVSRETSGNTKRRRRRGRRAARVGRGR